MRKLVSIALLLGSLPLIGCAHRVTVGDGQVYDFSTVGACSSRFAPPPLELPGEHVVTLRYLGSGGVAIRWRGEWVLSSPFFSNPGLLQVQLGKLAPDRRAIGEGLRGIPLDQVSAILIGHSHYDHIGDLPEVADLAPSASILVNRSGARALRAVGRLTKRVRVIEEIPVDQWTPLVDATGRSLQYRIRAVATGHAPHVLAYTWAPDNVAADWQGPWTEHRHRSLRAGTTYSFVIDLLAADGQPAGRVLLQDAAGAEGIELLPVDRPYDLAVVCMASAHKVVAYPESVLRAVSARHALVVHYESFFRSPAKPLRFVPLLTRQRADRFLLSTTSGIARQSARGPIHGSCGPSTGQWTMPLPGEWLQFRIPRGEK